MSIHTPLILAVDDDAANLDIIAAYLERDHYQLIAVSGGADALEVLNSRYDDIDAVLLDRMMPGMDGLEVVKIMKRTPEFYGIPVIMQTAASSPEKIAEGIKAGCFYYLTKPFDREVLREVIQTAVRDRDYRKVLLGSINHMKSAVSRLEEAEFNFRNRREANEIAALLSHVSIEPQSLSMGLIELMLNAIEHGNLGITYAEKTHLIKEDRLQEEIELRLNLPENARKYATIQYRRLGHSLIFTIKDEGAGFDWERYLKFQPDRAMDNHGRGIAMAQSLTFERLDYRGCGNVVIATRTESTGSDSFS